MTPDPPEAQDLLERMRRARGFVFPAFELLCGMDPGLVERYEALRDHVMGREAGFAEKYKELFVSVAIAVRDPSARGQVKLHVKRALELGATPEECLEAFEAALAPCGMMVLIAGAAALKEALDELAPREGGGPPGMGAD